MSNSPPQSFKKYVVTNLTNDFEKATQLITVNYAEWASDLKPNEVIVQNKHVGINASDINFTAGRYDPSKKPPFDCGFEAVGIIVAVGSSCKLKVGSAVGSMAYGAFAEYVKLDYRVLIPLPAPEKQYLAILVSGLTSSLALVEQGRMTSKETVLVTAAAGGAGILAVQLAKLAGNTVIGTCSSAEKVALLKSLGCDRVINYKTEDLGKVLRKEYPQGIDIVFESVGGKTFEVCFKNLAIRGRLIVIGAVSYYADESKSKETTFAAVWPDNVPSVSLLNKSSTVTGFFLPHYSKLYGKHLSQMISAIHSGKLVPLTHSQSFIGIESIPAAITCLTSGQNQGKVVVSFDKNKL